MHAAMLLLFAVFNLAAAELVAMRAPNNGIQPQAAVASDGTIHLIYYTGPADAGNIAYVRRPANEADFSAPITVNSQSGSAVALGSIRGAHLALGRDGWVHVAWMGSQTATKAPDNATPMLYSRLKAGESSFEKQRNLLTWAAGLDGGGSIAADEQGRVMVAWHAGPGQVPEAKRSVFIAKSQDDGETFAKETQAIRESTGACGCCGMRIAIGGDGCTYMLYRAAIAGIQRDMILAFSGKNEGAFRGTDLDNWKVGMCPMSTASMFRTANGVLFAWEGEAGLHWTRVVGGKTQKPVFIATRGAKHPSLAQCADGQIAVVWTEGTGWNQGGSLHWQIFAADGKPIGQPGKADGLPAWSIPTVIADGPGHFTAWY